MTNYRICGISFYMSELDDETTLRELARKQGIPEDEFIWVMQREAEGELIPEEQKPQWYKDSDAAATAWEQSEVGKARVALKTAQFLAYVSASQMIIDRDGVNAFR